MEPNMCARFVAVTLFCALPFSATFADERSDAIAAQKSAAAAHLKKLDVANHTIQETDDLFVCGSVGMVKAKALADQLQKHYAATVKALKFEGNERPWKGKLAIYVFLDKKVYASFVRTVEQRRPESEETGSSEVRSDEPHVAITAEPGARAGALEAEAARQVAAALLIRRASPAELPEWFKSAFARAVQMRTDPKSAGGDRAKVHQLLARRMNPVKPSDGWMGSDEKEKPIIAASVVEYLVFGPEATKFPMLLSGFRASEENVSPNMDTALKAAGMTSEGLDKAWRKWVQSGK
jgi:hypothetical protein